MKKIKKNKSLLKKCRFPLCTNESYGKMCKEHRNMKKGSRLSQIRRRKNTKKVKNEI